MDATRLSSSTGNRQSLKYIVVDEEGTLEEVFGTLKDGRVIFLNSLNLRNTAINYDAGASRR